MRKKIISQVLLQRNCILFLLFELWKHPVIETTTSQGLCSPSGAHSWGKCFSALSSLNLSLQPGSRLSSFYVCNGRHLALSCQEPLCRHWEAPAGVSSSPEPAWCCSLSSQGSCSSHDQPHNTNLNSLQLPDPDLHQGHYKWPSQSRSVIPLGSWTMVKYNYTGNNGRL